MKHCDLQLQIDGFPETDQLLFEDWEYNNICEYYEETIRISENIVMGKFKHIRFSISARVGSNVLINTELPEDNDIIIVIHKLRPFILQGERTYFNSIKNTILKRLSNIKIKNILNIYGDLFSTKALQRLIKLDVEGSIVNSEEYLMDYLNSFEYHRDKEKQERIKKVNKGIPDDIIKYNIVSMIIEKINAIRGISEIIAAILGKIEILNLISKLPEET